MKVQVRLNNYRRSASKVRELIPVIKGLDVAEAENQLKVLAKGSSADMLKLLLSAVAAAKNDFNLKEENLIVDNIMVQEGKTMKRWRARAYGRANQILKRSCHILLTVKEREGSIKKDKKEKKVSTGKGEKKVVKKVEKKAVKKVEKKETAKKKTVKKKAVKSKK